MCNRSLFQTHSHTRSNTCTTSLDTFDMTSLTGNPYDTGRLHDILTHHLRNIQSTLDALVYDVVRDITTSRQVLSSLIGIIRLPPGSLPDCMLCVGFCCILTTTCTDSTVQRRFFADSRRMALLPLRKAFTPPPFPQYQVLCIRTAAHLLNSVQLLRTSSALVHMPTCELHAGEQVCCATHCLQLHTCS